ncbi:MAG TPA: efflux RND transporter permease subunit [Hyphomicrobiaceae bacterium]|nr:efflux RND transporter permease subunit [Hyphomicrobiaceae bacterium]
MRTDVSAWAIRQPVPSLVLFIVLMALGIFSFQQIPVSRFPNIDIPIVAVSITQSGAAPSELETQVTKKVEDAVAGIVGVKHVQSNVVEGSSTTTVQFELGVPTDRATNDVKDAIARLRSELPRTIDDPITQRIDIEGLPILTYAARAPAKTLEELSWFVDDTIARALRGVNGVSKVERVGGVTREIRIALDPDRLLALGITAGDVNRQLRATNVDLAGGRGEIGGREQAIRTLAGSRTVTGLAKTQIALPGGRKVRLEELGTVTDTIEEPRLFADLDGTPVVGFSITRGKGGSETVVASKVEAELSALRKRYPDVEMTLIDTSVKHTKGVYESTMKTLIEGAILAVFVVFIFLRDLRATIIAAIALPLSIIPTFFLMDAIGFSLNLVSLLAITIVTGILVDDAIVEIENIVRHIRMGKSPYRASLEAADEIGLAVIAITVTIIAVFVPVSFMGGIAGQYFKQFGLTVAAAVFFSLLVARLITPMLAAYFMRETHHVDREGPMTRAYTALLGWSVRHRIITVAVGILIFIGSIASSMLLPNGFIPAEDNGRMLLAFELPPGSPLTETRRVAREISAKLQKRPEVARVFTSGGRILGSGDEVRKATLAVVLKEKSERKLSLGQLKPIISTEIGTIPDIRFWFIEENGQRRFQMVVLGRDGRAVNRTAATITSQMKRLPQLAQISSSAELDRPELRVIPKPDIAADLGVTTEAIAEAVRIATIGDIGPALAKFNAGDRLVPIRVQLKTTARSERKLIENLKVMTAGGLAVPLATVATFEIRQGPTSIERYDRQRQVTLGADLVGSTPLGDAVTAAKKLPAASNLPNGIEFKQFGDAEIMAEVFAGFAKAMAAGLMMVFSVLVLLFSSFLQPVTILFSLPLSIGGVIMALLFTNNPITLPVVIGILMLMGIVTKNAIMLVDFAIEEIRRGVPRNEAIIDAGRKRARPIIMTTIAMCGGMLPSALALESGGEFRAPMAIAVIGGLISSTVLSLIFVPAVFVLMDDIGKGIWWIFGRFVGETDEPSQPSEPEIPANVPAGGQPVGVSSTQSPVR